MNHRFAVPMLTALLAASTIFAGTAFVDVPAHEIIVNAPLTPVGSQDLHAGTIGKPDGQVLTVGLEDFRMKARHSADGGATFGSEVQVPAAGQPDVLDAAVSLSSDGKLYVAYIDADPGGDTGVRFTRSDDMGQTWTAPKILVAAGDPSIGVTKVHVATGGAGKAAVIYRGSEDSDPWVLATSDSGATWTTPQRIDSAVTARSAPTSGERVAMDATGRIYAVFVQNRGTGNTLFYTRSTNGGVSFGVEAAMGLPAHQDSEKPDVEVANDGSVLVAVWDKVDSDHIYVQRSTDQGVTFTNVLNRTLANDNFRLEPGFFVDPATATMFVGWIRSSGAVVIVRSANSGAAWGADQVLATTSSVGSPAALARTSTGTWVVAWTDFRSDSYSGTMTSVYARSSTDDGVTFGTEQRVDGGVAGTHGSTLAGVAANGTNNVFVLYTDGRDENARSFDLHANRSAASPLAFGTDARVDADDGTVPPSVFPGEAVAADGVSHAYVAFPAVTTGPQTDILVAASANAGRTFGTPLRVGSTVAGARINQYPELSAFSDGKIYLVYSSDNPGVGREVRFNRSTDFGATWQPTDTILATLPHPSGYFDSYSWPGITMTSLSDGSVYVAWSDGANVFLARSTDAGVTFSTADVDQDSRGFNMYPRICANGTLLVLAWESPNVALSSQSVWAATSPDRGMTWGTSKQLRTEGVGGSVDLHALACDASGHAVVVWPDTRTGPFTLFSSRFSGTTWSTDTAVTGPSGISLLLPDVTFVDATHAVVVYGDQFQSVYASRSSDDGATFPTFQRLDGSAPDPAAGSFLPRVASDGTGNVWALWADSSAGQASFVTRRSSDFGSSYGSIFRLDRKTPQGGYGSSADFPPYGSLTAVFPGALLAGWVAPRESPTYDAIVNAYDVNDFDRDGVPAGVDCNDSDPTLKTIPQEVAGLAMSKVTGATRLAWTSADPTAGTATSYDSTRGLLSALRSSGNFGGATCLVNDVQDTPYDDTGANPAVGDGFWYLVRGQNACGTGTYGRSLLDAASPCP